MKVPGFQIKRTIGRGGMATVYLAIQKSLEREVVLKCMDNERDGEKDFITRFLDEGRIIASLSHPHIITVHDIGTVDDMVWIAMEYVGGGDLKARIERETLPVEATLDLIEKVAAAFGYAHLRGIVHRDIKPANILFRNDGTVLLTDFGIAKQASMDRELTTTGTILGSPFYMSPEQAEGLEVDGRTDVYSLGVIFYELLTGHRPYQGDTAIKVIMQHIQSPVPTLPHELKRYQPLLDQMMAKNRDERIADADSLVRALNELRGDSPGSHGARSDTASRDASRSSESTQKWSTKKRLNTLGSCLVMVAAAMGVFYGYAKTLQNAALVQRSEPQGGSTAAIAPNTSSAPKLGSVSQDEVVRALEVLAQKSLREDRLTLPPADNAQYYFSRLLALAPAHKTAKQGFKEIAERFVILAEKQFSRRNYAKAQTYITLGLQVDPQSKALLELQSFIDNRERSLLDTFMGLFSSDS
ncbi:MAG: serine/threonine-protein kinase PpkA [Gammaproteobacteria bacterium]|jgi:serine/threonine-protein kinase PpkA